LVLLGGLSRGLGWQDRWPWWLAGGLGWEGGLGWQDSGLRRLASGLGWERRLGWYDGWLGWNGGWLGWERWLRWNDGWPGWLSGGLRDYTGGLCIALQRECVNSASNGDESGEDGFELHDSR
ncbi:hypothetical protein FA15DRAFT_743586, partial [Coprinopsis marcescibilis]